MLRLLHYFSLGIFLFFLFFNSVSSANDLQKASGNFSKAMESLNEFVGKGTKTYRHDYRETVLRRSLNRFHWLVVDADKSSETEVPGWARVILMENLFCNPPKKLAEYASWQAPLKKMDRGISALSGDTKKKGLSLIGSVFTESYAIRQIEISDPAAENYFPNKVFARCKTDLEESKSFLDNGEGSPELGFTDALTALSVLKDIWDGIVGIGEAAAKGVDTYKRETALRDFLTKDITEEKFDLVIEELQKFINDHSQRRRRAKMENAILSWRELNESMMKIYTDFNEKKPLDKKQPNLVFVSALLKKDVQPIVERLLMATDAYDAYFDAGSPAPINSLKNSFKKLVKQAKDDSFKIGDLFETAERIKGIYEDIDKRVKEVEEDIKKLKALGN